LAFHQALGQFILYTGKNPPIKKMQNAINEFYK
jgi:shikimate 5-dehydrogenase